MEVVDETVTNESVAVMVQEVVARNSAMINQLNLVGKGPTQQQIMLIEFTTLLDMLFDDAGERSKYELACHIRVNEALKATLMQLAGQLVVPGDD